MGNNTSNPKDSTNNLKDIINHLKSNISNPRDSNISHPKDSTSNPKDITSNPMDSINHLKSNIKHPKDSNINTSRSNIHPKHNSLKSTTITNSFVIHCKLLAQSPPMTNTIEVTSFDLCTRENPIIAPPMHLIRRY